MYRNIRNDIFAIVLSCLSFTIFGMESEEVRLSLQKPVCQIPDLYINNYIVNVSSAYQGLKREIFMVTDIVRSVSFERVNRREIGKSPVPFLFNTPSSRSYIKHTHPAQCPSFVYMYALCRMSSDKVKILDMDLRVYPYVYVTEDEKLKWIPCSEGIYKDWGDKLHRWMNRIVGHVVERMAKKNIQGKAGVELWYPNRLSDWLIIEKRY